MRFLQLCYSSIKLLVAKVGALKMMVLHNLLKDLHNYHIRYSHSGMKIKTLPVFKQRAFSNSTKLFVDVN